MRSLVHLTWLMVFVVAGQAQSESKMVAETNAVNSDSYVDLQIDNIVVDTDGLIGASDQLSRSIERLSQSLNRLATESDTFTAEEKKQLIDAATSVSKASVAVENMALQLPQSIQQLGQQLPKAIASSEKPINQISNSITTAAGGIQTVVNTLPQATENVRLMALDVVNSVFWQMIKFGLLFVFLVIAIIGLSIWVFYRRWIQPVLEEYRVLSDAPRQFALMSEHMKATSENLLIIRELDEAVVVESPRAEHQRSTIDENELKPPSEILENEPDPPTPKDP